MDLEKYTLKNWRELLEKDWDYLKGDDKSRTIETIINKLLELQSDYIAKIY